MTPNQAARAVAEDLEMIGTQDAVWLARWWYRYAHYLSTPTLELEEGDDLGSETLSAPPETGATIRAALERMQEIRNTLKRMGEELYG